MGKSKILERLMKFISPETLVDGSFKKEAHKFRPETEKNERGQIVYFRKFRKQQLLGAVIRVDKKTAFRISATAELSGDRRMVDGEHEMRKLKIR
jgi:hypothetical protein